MKTKYRSYLVIIILIYFLVFGLEWLSIGIILFIMLYKIGLYCISFFRNNYLRKLVKGLFLIMFIFSIAIGIKLFAFDIYKIPSSSMKNSLYTGDVILVNKLLYGPRLPRSPFEIPWVNIAFYLNDNARASMRKDWWSYKRLYGTTKINQGDVFVFQNFSKTSFIVKRCVGLAGDKFQIKKGQLYINNKLKKPLGTVREKYKFKILDKKIFSEKMGILDINEIIRRDVNNRKFRYIVLSYNDLEKIKDWSCIDSLQPVIDSYSKEDELFPESPNFTWSLDDYGPFQIPKKGIKINLNKNTFALYRDAIHKFENVKIEIVDGNYLVEGKKETTYIFKHDYYFMMGDNRKGSIDSRYFGFVPEKNIVGKVQKVLFSNQYGEFKWNRFMKSVN